MKKISFVLLIISLIGCVDDQLPTEPSKLTVFGFFKSGAWEVRVSQSRPFFHSELNDPVLLSDAQVQIYDGTNLFLTLETDQEGVFREQSEDLTPGKRYDIKVSHSGRYVEAFDILPVPVKISAVEINKEVPFATKGNDNVRFLTQVKFQLEDNPGQRDYYHIFANGNVNSNSWLLDNYNYSSGIFFSDSKFDKDGYVNLEIFVENFAEDVKIRRVSKNFYDYIVTVDLNNGSYIYDDEPVVEVHSNVELGYGIFAGYSEYVIEIPE